MSIQKDLSPFAKSIESLMSTDFIRTKAKETGFVKRVRSFKPEDFFLLCTLFDQSVAIQSLEKMSASLSMFTSKTLSKQALDQRFTPEAADFLYQMFIELAAKQRWLPVPCDMMNLFSRILIQDSTEFQLTGDHPNYPSANGSGVKVQYEFELYSGMFTHLSVESGLSADRASSASIVEDLQPGDLTLKDLGYFSSETMKKIDKQKAYYVSKLPSHVSLWERDKEKKRWDRVDPVAIGQQLSPGESTEFASLRVGAKTKKSFRTRVVIQKLTPSQQRQRDQTLHKKRQNGKPTQSAKQRDSIQILVTNVTQEMMEAQALYALYSLRWQIEILFKSWKSHFKIHENKNIKDERLECHVYGTLIRILLSSMIAFQCRYFLHQKKQHEASEFKSIGFAKEALHSFARVLRAEKKGVLEILVAVYQNISRNGRKDHRRKHLSPFDIIGVEYEPKR